MQARLAALHCYPVKGLSPQPLDRAGLVTGGHFPCDRLFAVENGPSGFDPAEPAHQPKTKFLMLMRDERLATLRSRYDDADTTLKIAEGAAGRVEASLATEEGRAAIEAFFGGFMPEALRGTPRVLTAPEGFRFTDFRRGFVSILNLASVAAVEAAVGAPVDPLRFRANLHLEGWPAWHEFDLVGREITIGNAVRLKITKRIVRCAATEVDPVTGQRDLPIPRTLMKTFGHADCGVYAEIAAGGAIAAGDVVAILPEVAPPLPF